MKRTIKGQVFRRKVALYLYEDLALQAVGAGQMLWVFTQSLLHIQLVPKDVP